MSRESTIWWPEEQSRLDRLAYWDRVNAGEIRPTFPQIIDTNPTRQERRWEEQIRLTKSLLRGDCYFEEHYPMCISVEAALKRWDERNPE